MTYKRYILVIALVALAGWVSLVLVIYKLDPCAAVGTLSLCDAVSPLAIMLFFFSLFFALTATFTLMGFGIRLWLHKYEIYLDHLNISMRQGILLSLATIGSLGLLLLNALTWWSGFLLILIILLVELYFTRLE